MSPNVKRGARRYSKQKTGRLFRSHLQLLALLAIGFLIASLVAVRFIRKVSADTGTGTVSLSAFGTAATENFDSLSNVAGSTTNATLPTGWYITEQGGGARDNEQYAVDTGGSNTGDTYSYGATSSTDRALGGLRSGTLIPLFGAKFTNNTGGTITSLDVSYTGEEWRLGTAARADQINLGISTNATDLTTGTYTAVPALNFTTPNQTTSGARDGNAAENRTLVSSTITGLSIVSGASFFIRWTDVDASSADDGLAVDDFSITPNGTPGDTAPLVNGTTPTNAATNVAVNSNIVINFNESVTASPSAFSIQCPSTSPQAFSQSASPAISFTLDPTSDLPYSTTCSVTVTASQISDSDVDDPPDHMTSDFSFSFTTTDPPTPVATNVIINEVEADTPGTDTAEFIELYDGGVGNTSLNGLVVVLFNGNGDVSYNAFDLDGFTTDANGYFVLGDNAVPGRDLVLPDGFIQNGQDAVALYAADSSNFPNGTPVTTTNLQDAVVYDNGQSDDAGLLVLLNAGQPQVDEGGTTSSLGRCPNGSGGVRNTSTFFQGAPSPDGANTCPPPQPPSSSPILISQLYGGGGNSGATYQNDYVELYNRSASPVDVTGWSIQYTAADGDSWDFNKQPIGGIIGPGEYYLIALGSSGAVGAPLPAANINGQINMAATSGKLALVNSFDGLVGNCPLGDTHLMDMVGYGTPDCREGPAPAPAPSSTTAIFRAGGGSTDTNNNGSDFVVGAPNPRRTTPIQELGPLVLSTDPRNNGTNAPRDASMTVTFTEPVNVDDPWFDITCINSGQHNTATFAMTNGGRTHVITPNVNFVAGEQCTATILAGQIHDVDTDDSGMNTDTLPANYVWSFTVSMGTAPPYPSSVHLMMGDPGCGTIYGCAIASTSQPNNFLMDKPEFTISYNRDRGGPNWVSWHLSDEWIGTLTRVDTFRPDPGVPPEWYRVQAFDFAGTGFDRGHMTPNADRDKETSIPINQATFLMSNMLPQAPDNNQGPWADLENYLRSLLPGNEIYIVAGGYGTGGTGSNGSFNTIANGHVTVPSSTWKVALVLPQATGDDTARVSCSTRTIAVIMPNVQGIRNNPWESYLTTVDAVETLTGYNFFSNLPPAVQACVEAGMNGVNPPGTASESANTTEDTEVTITLDALRSNNNTLSFSIVNGPQYGSLGSLSAATCSEGSCSATVTYTPGSNFNGTDSFTFKASDGAIDSNTSTVTIGVTPVNDAPTANSQSVSTSGNTSLSITLTGSDVETPAANLTFTVTSGPTVGSLSGTAPNLTYAPAQNACGVDSLKFTVTDTGDGSSAALTSAEATVFITVNDTIAPTITLTGGSLTLSPPNHTYWTFSISDMVASASDYCDSGVDINDVVIAKVTSDELEDAPGTDDGSTLNDIVIAPDCKSVQLRAERNGSLDGRVYTVTLKVADSAGNVTTVARQVTVPISPGFGAAVDSGPAYTVNSLCP